MKKELEAMNTAWAALEPLDITSKIRAVKWLLALYHEEVTRLPVYKGDGESLAQSTGTGLTTMSLEQFLKDPNS